jgi:hypothetical protein
MHYWDGQWKETAEEIVLVDGGGLASRGPHKAFFAANINSVPAVELTFPDERALRTRILGIAYYDPVTGTSELIAELRDSIGELVSANQIIYRDCFDGIKADVRFAYRKAGFEQDIILRQKPQPPGFYGMSEHSRIQVWTELFDPPTPATQTLVLRREEDALKRANMIDPDFKDQALNFGTMQIGRGRAFRVI